MTATKAEKARKAAILHSTKYHAWLAARQAQGNFPSDPYRAFMIDLSLAAKIESRAKWIPEPNESDLTYVDYPLVSGPLGGDHKKHGRPSKRELELEAEHYKSAEMPQTPKHKKLAAMGEKLFEKHGVPAPIWDFRSNEGILGSYARVGVGVAGKEYFKTGRAQTVHVGTKEGKDKPTYAQVAATAHEAGHIIHAQMSLKGKIGDLKIEGISPYTGDRSSAGKGTIADEEAAWKIGRSMMEANLKKGPTHIRKAKPDEGADFVIDQMSPLGRAKWLQVYALKTYRQPNRKVIRLEGGGIREIWEPIRKK